jgi:hypothetical protein
MLHGNGCAEDGMAVGGMFREEIHRDALLGRSVVVVQVDQDVGVEEGTISP